MRKKLFIQPSTLVLFEKVEKLFSLLSKELRYAIVTDKTIEKLHGRQLEKELKRKGLDVFSISIPSGEQHKTRETKRAIEDAMIARGLGRDSCIIALGGGVVTDLAGFVAATYCRGISLLSIPTTLLGMVDASIGGKTGVNTPTAKNLIGAFYPASLVLIDSAFLDTLPEKERKNGYAEIIKYGLISSKPLFHLLERQDPNISEIIYRSICIKKKTTEADPHEKGLRRILNFGHTIGHAIETLLTYRISHGEAVAIGMAIESYLSMQLKRLKPAEYTRILSVLDKYGFCPRIPEGITFSQLMKAMSMDKKARLGSPRFVILRTIGDTVPFEGSYCTSVNPKLIKKAYDNFSH